MLPIFCSSRSIILKLQCVSQSRFVSYSTSKVLNSNSKSSGLQVSSPPSKANVLLVNHGYPSLFNAGSEIYTQTLALGLQQSQQVKISIFTREMDPFSPDFRVRLDVDALNPSIPVHLVNHPREAPYHRFLNLDIGSAFEQVLAIEKPAVVHFGHLNHLSLDLPSIAKRAGAATVYTLHDFWLMCPRGQFLVCGPTSSSNSEAWAACSGQVNRKCAEDCFSSRYGTGSSGADVETEYWTEWVEKRMAAVRAACEDIDLFLCPSHHLHRRFAKEFGLPPTKLKYLPYGFNYERLSGRTRIRDPSDPFVFGYIGRHSPSKGIQLLITAAAEILIEHPELASKLKIAVYGRIDPHTTASLQQIVAQYKVPSECFSWLPEYRNQDIVDKVFNHIDCIVVPSLWDENSPLVIHEAQQVKVPVITSSQGGMGELVQNNVNGMTFEHRNLHSLKKVMLKVLADPGVLDRMGRRGYLHSEDGKVPSDTDHVNAVLHCYRQLQDDTGVRIPAPLQRLPGPWRITFDTNPDDCNFRCTMCEQHSIYSPHQEKRKQDGTRRRRMDVNLIRKVVAEAAPWD